jgi:histidine triad (HIT) family protein
MIMKKNDCIFCKLANGEIPTNALYEDDVVKVIFDLGPASKGHVLILPKNHFDNIYSMDSDTAAHVFQVAVKMANAMKAALNFDGLNIVQNNGEIAGQTVFHFHLHLIPRYEGDTVNVTWVPGEITSEEVAELKEKIAAQF